MVKLNFYRAFLVICLGLIGNLILEAKENRGAKGNGRDRERMPRILIVGLNDNVKSNYFYAGMIADETGMEAEHIDREYNRIIAENIVAANRSDDCCFVTADPEAVDEQFSRSVRMNGEEEDCYPDLSSVSPEVWRNLMDEADYLLMLNRHYLKWQDEPLRTLFHIVSYTLFDREGREIYRGNNYFTSMNLEKPDALKRISRKSSSRIAANVIRSLDIR
ncbi:MAG: hypothetical protein LBP25_04300 [Tannerellaceae bacterium]|jgi:hypothetical protein|nr:hypothetical protein [Tannerellaceae bacterium]